MHSLRRRRIDAPALQWLLLALALAASVGASGVYLYREYRAIEAREHERLATQATVIEKNLGQQLAATALALDAMRREIPELKTRGADARQFNQRLKAMSNAMPSVRTLLYLDATGTARASDREQLLGQRFDQRAYFRVARQASDPAALYVSPPFRTVLGVFSLNVTKAVVDQGDRFAGVVTATLDPGYIMTLLDSVRYADDMRVSVAHADGQLFLGAPAQTSAEPAAPDLADSAAGLVARRAIQPAGLAMDKALHLVVTRDRRRVFAEWRRNAWLALGALALLGVSAALGLAWYQRQLARIAAARDSVLSALTERDAQLGIALDATQIGLWDWDLESGLWHASAAYFTMLGDAVVTAPGPLAPWSARAHPDDREMIAATVDAALRGSTALFQFEARLRHADGSYRWLAVQGRAVDFAATGRPRRMRGACIDISARKQAEQALAQSEARWRFALEGAGDGVWDWNIQTGAAFFSRRYKEMLGYAEDEFGAAAEEWARRVHAEDMPAVNDLLQRYLDGATPALEVEFRMRCKNGEWKWIHGRGMLVERDASGRPLRLVGTNTDITERKLAEQELKQHRDELSGLVADRTRQLEMAMQSLLDAHDALAQSEARATLSTMIASVTHELATPIGNSALTADNLKERTREFAARVAAGRTRRTELDAYTTAMAEGTALMQRSLLRARELLGHFKQVAADQASEQRRRFDLAQEVGEVVATLMPSLKRQPHRIAIEIPPGIVMDSLPGALGQVIINLVNNAYLHAFEGRQDGRVTISAAAQDEHVHLSVSDNGNGIAEDHLDLIFKPFFSTKIGRGGTGLGMAIIENLVRRTLCGSLQVRSAPATGTRVEMRLPRALPGSTTVSMPPDQIAPEMRPN